MDAFSDGIKVLQSREARSLFAELYGEEAAEVQRQISRYMRIINEHDRLFGEKVGHLFSAPGRTEIGGNHTDHSGGMVLSASVNLDSIAAVSQTDDNVITVYSEGFSEPFKVNINEPGPLEHEEGKTSALIRGIATKFKAQGHKVGGFNAYITSDVLIGSGLSSSASIEVLLAIVLNELYNNGSVKMLELAQICQFAENVFFNKPCGLMDQITCAFGGIITIDFGDFSSPVVKKVKADFARSGHQLAVVDTGSDHADLTDDYAAVPREMKEVCTALRKSGCREITLQILLENLGRLRRQVSDRAILRMFHFITENERVVGQVSALEAGDYRMFFSLVSESGKSSMRWLQNSFSLKNPHRQGITLALALTEHFLKRCDSGACRVHGGGFAGTVQAFIPFDHLDEYTGLMENVFGKGSVKTLLIRPYGALHVTAGGLKK